MARVVKGGGGLAEELLGALFLSDDPKLRRNCQLWGKNSFVLQLFSWTGLQENFMPLPK